MANVDAATGLTPVRYLSGSDYNGATNRYCIPATDGTAAYIGAMVKIAGDADADGVPTVTSNVATGNPVIGVIVSVEPVTADSLVYRAASTLRYVRVADDPNLVFEIQCNGTLTSAMIGNVADVSTPTTGTTATGRSLAELNIATVSAAGDGTEDFHILRLAPRPDNEIGADAKVWVRLNNHALVDGYAGA